VLYDSPALRQFVGVDLGMATVTDETTILRFRHLIEEHYLDGAMLDKVNRHLATKGIRITTGTIVDATIIHAPSSTKNSTGERDPEMHQTRKGIQLLRQTRTRGPTQHKCDPLRHLAQPTGAPGVSLHSLR
jgi:IS5 family transposase